MTQKSKKLWQLLTLLAADLALLILISTFTANATHMGDSGERVAAIQQALAEKGLFSEKISGIYCTKTDKAIKKFRQGAGISHSGEADHATLKALGISSRTDLCFSYEVELLARCIQQSGCHTYSEMLKKGLEILNKTKAARTLGSCVSDFYPDILRAGEPSSDAYSAALHAMMEQ